MLCLGEGCGRDLRGKLQFLNPEEENRLRLLGWNTWLVTGIGDEGQEGVLFSNTSCPEPGVPTRSIRRGFGISSLSAIGILTQGRNDLDCEDSSVLRSCGMGVGVICR